MSRQYVYEPEAVPAVDEKMKERIWTFRKLGWTKDGISRQLKVPVKVVERVVEKPRVNR